MTAPAQANAVPKPMLPVYGKIIGLTDAFCDQHLNAEYRELARKMTAALCRKRPSPLASGQPRTWACGIIYVLGRINFLSDPTASPHLPTGELRAAFEVGESTLHAKARAIDKALNPELLDPRWTLQSTAENYSAKWLTEMTELLPHLRKMPRQIQKLHLKTR